MTAALDHKRRRAEVAQDVADGHAVECGVAWHGGLARRWQHCGSQLGHLTKAAIELLLDEEPGIGDAVHVDLG